MAIYCCELVRNGKTEFMQTYEGNLFQSHYLPFVKEAARKMIDETTSIIKVDIIDTSTGERVFIESVER